MNEPINEEFSADEAFEEIYRQDEDARFLSATTSVESPHETRDITPIVGLANDIEIESFARTHNLTPEQQNILSVWLREGVQSNTSAWFMVTKAFFSEVDPHSQDKYLSTLLFMDAMNRADEIFDTRRDLFGIGNSDRINPDNVNSLAILKLSKGKCATVRDMRQLVLKIIASSPEYSDRELDHIKWQMEHFIDISTEFQREFEAKDEYTFDEALALRFGTVGPLVDTFANIFCYSADVVSSGQREQDANQKISEFRRAVLAWQLSDDLNDLAIDMDNQNTNLVAGLLREEGEIAHFDESNYVSYDEFVFDCPRTAARLRSIYEGWTSQLHPGIKDLLDSRVPYFYTSDDNYHSEDESEIST